MEQAIANSGKSKRQIAKDIGINRQTLYNQMELEEPRLDIFLKVGKLIDHDFSKEIPELKIELKDQENLSWKAKYHDLLEKHILLLEELQRKDKANGNTTASETNAPSAPKVRQRAKRK